MFDEESERVVKSRIRIDTTSKIFRKAKSKEFFGHRKQVSAVFFRTFPPSCSHLCPSRSMPLNGTAMARGSLRVLVTALSG